MDCMAVWMSCIQVLRSSFELAKTSIISGFSVPAVMRKRPRSLLATSLTISFWREMTVERWSFGETREDEKKGRVRWSQRGRRAGKKKKNLRERSQWEGQGREDGKSNQGKIIGEGVNYSRRKNKCSEKGRKRSYVWNQGDFWKVKKISDRRPDGQTDIYTALFSCVFI